VLSVVAVEGYRSLREVVIPLGRLTIVTGPNGSGKSSLYRSLRLLAECARGGAVAALAAEGGLQSTLWAGPEQIGRAVREGESPVQGTRRSGPVALRVGFASEDGFGYAADLGLPVAVPGDLGEPSLFNRDPEFKVEAVWSGAVLRSASVLAERHGPLVRTRAEDGSWLELSRALPAYFSMVSQVADPARAPELLAVRERMRAWRFYDRVRTDAEAPARGVRVGTRTVALDDDGAALAAALQTIREIGDAPAMDAAVADAFPGSRVQVEVADDGRFEMTLTQPGLLRPLRAAELSEGTLRFLVWVAALLSPRPPELVVLNEPENSLHPDLLPALGRLLVTAAARSQVVAVTHSAQLVALLAPAALDADLDLATVELAKDDFGRTTVGGQEGPLDSPAWHWPSR
jgi:predicted ATPase